MITHFHLFLLIFLVYFNASMSQKSDGTLQLYHPTGVSPPTLLPEDEVQALRELLKMFGDTISIVNNSFCPESNVKLNLLKVSCSCTWGDGFCHIIEINATRSGVPISRSSITIDATTSSDVYIIPGSMFKLTFLKTLILSNVDIQSSIPDFVGKLWRLEYLDLSVNQLIGRIPNSIGNLHLLQALDLSKNQLTGRIPMSIAKLPSLQKLHLWNNLLQGDIPTLKNLVNLTELDLHVNNLTGPIPDALGKQLLMLQHLDLSENRLIGSLPKALGNLTKMTYLDVGSNFLTGEIPNTFTQLTSLDNFGAYGNNMSGTINVLKNWNRLQYLVLIGNNFEGPLPDEIFMRRNLVQLMVSDIRNDHYYRFPRVHFTRMQKLVLRNCSISGGIPSYIGDATSLYHLDLSFNNLSGVIPSYFKNQFLNYLIINNNNLEGEIPELTFRLQTRDFSFNKFTKGRVRTVTNQYANYFNCCATDNVPNTVSLQGLGTTRFCEMSKQRTSLYINCGGDEMTINGTRYEKDNDKTMFHVSNNWAYSCNGPSYANFKKNLSCGIGFSDVSMFATARVCPVSLKYYGLCFRNGKYDVTLHFAEIQYNRNEDYSSLRKRIFDVYIQGERLLKDYNIVDDAKGPDKGISKKFSAINVKNNILEIHLYWAGKGSLIGRTGHHGVLISAIAVTPCKSSLSPLEIAMIAIACVVFLALLVIALAWHQGWLGDKRLYEKCIDIRGKKISVKQLIKSTGNFSSKKEIGKGGFGTVYKVELPGQVIAVKKLSPRSKQGVEEFRRELFSLKSLRHKSIVELLDGYSGFGYHLLIYEYMENKSLADVLFDPNSKLSLNWEVRYKICKDIALALKYLHEETHLSMIHGDIKATNILLDGAYNAKISDFGLAKVYVEDDPSTVVKVGGTTGYMAPEYATEGILSHKADVYSFGVVLLEIISGKKNAQHKQRQESEFLLDTAYVLFKNEKTMDLVDQDLRECLHERDSYHQAKSLLFLAMMCTSLSHSLRPSMSEVVSVLEGEKTIEQVSNDHSIAPASTLASSFRPTSGGSSESSVIQKSWTPSDISPTSTDISCFTSTAHFIIKDKDEKKEQLLPGSTLEISHDHEAN